MLWYKAWLECRFRFILSLLLLPTLLATSVLVMPPVVEKYASDPDGAPSFGPFLTTAAPGSAQFKDELGWRIVLDMFAGIYVPICGLILAGSGINAQTNWGMRQGTHPSMHFTLSLPVSRRRLFATRAALGLVLFLAWLLLGLLIVVVASRFSMQSLSSQVAWTVLPYLLAGTLALYAFAVWLSAAFDEFWAGVIGMGIAGFLLGLTGSKKIVTLLGFMEARPVLAGHGVPWTGFAVCFGLTVLFLAGSLYLIEKREY